jgi:hypothetical protein
VIELDGVTVCSSDALLRFVLALPYFLPSDEVDRVASVAIDLVRHSDPSPASVPQQTSPFAPPARSQPTPTPQRRARRAAAPLVGLVGAVAFLLVGLPLISRAINEATSAPLVSAVQTATQAAPSSAQVVATSAALIDAPPTVEFSCPTPGGGWIARAVPTVFAADPVGYHMAYQLGTAPWVPWGVFRSGISSVYDFGPVRPNTVVNVVVQRDATFVGEGATPTATFVAPATAC